MTPLEELAAKLRTFWLRDIGATSAAVSGAGSDGSVALARTLFIPAAGGLVGINQIPTDPYALDVVGNGRIAGNLYARAGNSWNIGADGTPWGAIYASELHVGNLIAENKIATTGGRILVSPSAKLILAMTTGATTIDVATNVLTSGDRIYLESTGKLEWMAVTSGSTAVNGGYRYSVTRNLNGAGAQTWSAGDAVVNTGQTGQGFIDLYSRYGIPANGQTATTRQGPTIVGNVRTGSTFDAIKERWAVGNLKGLYDYAGTTYGFAAGDPTAAWISVDATNGLRIVQASAVRLRLSPAGNLFINDSGGNAVFTFDSALGAEFTLPLTLATTGGIYQGTGTFASPTTGLKIFNSGGIGKIAGYNASVVQWYADTDGKLYAGAGAVWLDSTGVNITLGSSYSAPAAIKWGANVVIYGIVSAGVNRLYLSSAQPGSGTIAETNVLATGGSSGGGGGQINLTATGNGASATLTLLSTGNHTLSGNLGFYGATSGTAKLQAAAVAGTPTLTLPTSTGTLALTSDVTTAVSGTSGTIAKFTGTNVVGNSIITESGAKIEITGALIAIGQSDTNQLIVKGHSTQTAAQIVIQSSAGTEWLPIRALANGSFVIGKGAAPSLTSADTIAIGNRALEAATSSSSIAIGDRVLKAMTSSGHTNVGVGRDALQALTGGHYNFAFGIESLYSNLTADSNVAVGIQTLYYATAGSNIGIGNWAFYSNVSGTENVGIGDNAGFHNTGSYNVEIGGNVGYNSLGSNTVLIGFEAGRTSGAATITDSVYVGYRAGYGASAGNNNVGIGSGALPKTVANAVAVGYQAGNVQTGAGFTAVGYQAGKLSTTGTNSTLIGYQAGASLTTNGGCVMLGYQAGGNETAANKLYIHNSNSTTPLIYGDFSTPSLTFNGTVNIQDAKNIVFGTTTGTKLGATTSDKLAFWAATPIVQPTTGVAAATFTANSGTAVNDASTFDGYTLKQVVKALRNMGALA